MPDIDAEEGRLDRWAAGIGGRATTLPRCVAALAGTVGIADPLDSPEFDDPEAGHGR